MPEERYGSCGEFADALREAIGIEPYDPSGRVRIPGKAVRGRAAADTAAKEAARAIPTKAMTIPPDPPVPVTWTAVVTADHTYYNSVHAEGNQDAASISFPGDVPERRFQLSGTKVLIGLRSKTLQIKPEIDLTGPPKDPGVSRLHAVLTAGPDGTWSVTDPGTENGILLNGKEVPPRETVPLRDGDRLHLGMWTLITIMSDPG